MIKLTKCKECGCPNLDPVEETCNRCWSLAALARIHARHKLCRQCGHGNDGHYDSCPQAMFARSEVV